MKRLIVVCFLMLLASSWALGQRQSTTVAGKPTSESQPLAAIGPAGMQGPRFTAQVMGGLYVDVGLGPGAPEDSPIGTDFEYSPIHLRLGYLLNSPPEEKSLLRGAAEVLADLMVAPVTEGFADIVAGPSVFLRYNFVQPNTSFVPYIQVGAGIVYSDAYKTEGQDALGQAVEFILQCQGGVRWMLSDKVSLDFEAGFHHISNAGFGDRNVGINNLGGSIGFTYYLPRFGP